MTAVATPPPHGTVFTRDPVQITTAIFFLLGGVVAVLTATEVFSATLGGVLSGVITVAWGAVNQLFVKPATVPRQPLAELAYEEAHPTSTSTTKHTGEATA